MFYLSHGSWQISRTGITVYPGQCTGRPVTFGRTGSKQKGCQTFLSSRLIMNSRWLWNSHQRHKFLRAEASGDILKFSVSEMAFPGIFKRNFPPRTPCCFVRIHARLRIMPQAFHDIARFEHFTDLNLFKYAFIVIQNCGTYALQFYPMVPIFCQQLW